MLLQLEGLHRSEYPELFETMFYHRKVVFHDQRRWDVKIVDGRYEIDEYDRDDTCYLLSLNEQGELVGSLRLISTATHHMLSGPFRSMFPDTQFCSPLIWEVTRFAVLGDRSVQKNLVSTAACELLLGSCQFALRNGVRHMTSVYDAGMLRLYRRCGMPGPEHSKKYLGPHGKVFAGIWETSAALERSILEATGLGAAALVHQRDQRAA